ncbi:helix-turn-helix domain-containing protein [Microbacterium sp. PI-1]|uniref:helix-turn-helix domain-containing protein n=1 Tax=Microbacterium sp. PI-1 TaxID=2545631 RepID=UPI001039E5B6|nr:helix-turn-helix domain-containing protein [Microbacterium sp. PI-1]TCJ29813.1 helix-turn-helix domain-containing protein [Microbacterium sp. PI-1]
MTSEPAFVAHIAPRRAFAVASLTTYARQLPFVRLPAWAFCIPSHTAFRTYAAMLAFADLRTGECWPSLAAIADTAGLSRATVARGLEALRALGVVTWKQQHDADGQASNRYTVAMDPANAPAALADTAAEPVDNLAVDTPVSLRLRLTPVSDRDSPPSQPETRNENHENKSQRNQTRASAPALDDRCSRHIGVADPPACRGCRDARLAAEATAVADAESERTRRAAALQTLDSAAVEALSRRVGGSPAAVIEAARAEMPGNLPLGLSLLARRDDAAEAVARWER